MLKRINPWTETNGTCMCVCEHMAAFNDIGDNGVDHDAVNDNVMLMLMMMLMMLMMRCWYAVDVDGNDSDDAVDGDANNILQINIVPLTIFDIVRQTAVGFPRAGGLNSPISNSFKKMSSAILSNCNQSKTTTV